MSTPIRRRVLCASPLLCRQWRAHIGRLELSAGVELEVFSDLTLAEHWLDRPASRLLREES
jgi:hypothetical protein